MGLQIVYTDFLRILLPLIITIVITNIFSGKNENINAEYQLASLYFRFFFSFVVYISKTSFVDNSSMSTIYIAQYAVVITFNMYANHRYLSVLLLLLLKICQCIDCMHAEMSVVGLSEYKHDLAFLPMVNFF